MGRGFACKYFHEPSDDLSILGGPPSLPATGFSVFERSFPFHVAAFLMPFLYPHTWKCMLRFVLASTPARAFLYAFLSNFTKCLLWRALLPRVSPCFGCFEFLYFLEKIPLGQSYTKAAFSAILHYFQSCPGRIEIETQPEDSSRSALFDLIVTSKFTPEQ